MGMPRRAADAGAHAAGPSAASALESERELLLRCKRLCTEKLRALEVPATPLQLSQPDAELFM